MAPGFLAGPPTHSEQAAWPPCPDCPPGLPASCWPGGGLRIPISLFQIKEKSGFNIKGCCQPGVLPSGPNCRLAASLNWGDGIIKESQLRSGPSDGGLMQASIAQILNFPPKTEPPPRSLTNDVLPTPRDPRTHFSPLRSRLKSCNRLISLSILFLMVFSRASRLEEVLIRLSWASESRWISFSSCERQTVSSLAGRGLGRDSSEIVPGLQPLGSTTPLPGPWAGCSSRGLPPACPAPSGYKGPRMSKRGWLQPTQNTVGRQ